MKNKLNITKGEWLRQHWVNINEVDDAPIEIINQYNSKIADLCPNVYDAKSVKGNGILIVDAGNTYQKCETLPSDLLKQRDELFDVLMELIPDDSPIKGVIKGAFFFGPKRARIAIQNAKS